MQAGELNKTIAIEKPVTIQNKFGANEIEWQTFVSKTRAKVTYDSGNRVDENDEITFAYGVTFTIREYHKIDERMRIIWEDRKYRILAIERMRDRINVRTELINE